jgi:predicted transcriptional regulator YheO
MSSRTQMEAILHDLLPDLQALYKTARNQNSKRKIQRYIERIHQALANDEAPQQ